MHSLISLVERVRNAFITVIYKWRTKHARVPRRAAAVCIEFCRCFEVVHGSNSRQTGNIDAGNLRDHTDLITGPLRHTHAHTCTATQIYDLKSGYVGGPGLLRSHSGTNT